MAIPKLCSTCLHSSERHQPESWRETVCLACLESGAGEDSYHDFAMDKK